MLLRIFGSLVCAASVAAASTVWGTPDSAELTGSRLESLGEIDSAGTGFGISWIIGFDSVNNVWDYSYTINGPSGGGLGVSHFALELSQNCVTPPSLSVSNSMFTSSSGGVLGSPQSDQSTLTYGCNTNGNGDTNYPGSFWGVRFFPVTATQLPIKITFTSPDAPAYGDFYVKLGSGADAAWNNGSAAPSDTWSSTTDYIPVPLDPSEVTATPEPSTLALAALGLIGAAFLKRREKKFPNGPRA